MPIQPLPLSDPNWWDHFKQLLDENNEWPAPYLFKFIVPKAGIEELKSVLEGHDIDIKASTKGNYLSLTTRIRVESSEDVVAVYRSVGVVEGLIAL
ncbi:MAG: DUF493 family protein [Bacteroidetes bacterium]|nr:DUF493 family protein [Bacteroidota bacterium]MDA0875201.1 DUF493 family protein [Bacteroidota bacterium]